MTIIKSCRCPSAPTKPFLNFTHATLVPQPVLKLFVGGFLSLVLLLTILTITVYPSELLVSYPLFALLQIDTSTAGVTDAMVVFHFETAVGIDLGITIAGFGVLTAEGVPGVGIAPTVYFTVKSF